MSEKCLVRVALPVPLPGGFDYLCPAGQARPPVGARVRVPFGRGERIGVVIGHPRTAQVDDARLKPIRETLDDEALLDSSMLRLVEWASNYYHQPIGEVVSIALPAHLRDGRPLIGEREQPWQMSEAGREALAGGAIARAPRQREALELLSTLPALTAAELTRRGFSADLQRRLREKAWIEEAAAVELSPAGPRHKPAVTGAPVLSADQQTVLDGVISNSGANSEADAGADAGGFGAHLIHGVTGSGKTEVYLRLIQHELERGRQALLLVPEISLTPQMLQRLQDRFGRRLAVMHSGLGDFERFDAWRRAREGKAHVVVGTRSAVFASLPNLGLIVVDEEHDASFKQQTGFRYSARDIAIVRAQQLDIRVVLGSATPSLESLQNTRSGRYHLHRMPNRIGSGGQPRFVLVDLREHANRQGLSTPLIQRMEVHLAAGNQVLLFLNRRGFAPVLFCPKCEKSEDCDRCDARLTVHARAGRLRCHHCGRERPLQWGCADCGSERIGVGAGTQRVMEELESLFPDVQIARLDRDVTARKGALDDVLERVASGKTRIIVGTQMLTKGHDFPRVTLVGVLNADQGLFGTDFRSDERLAQTIVQVAGRAGRRDTPGEVVIQTHYPAHPLLAGLISAGYGAFAQLALLERESAAWPPFSHVAILRAHATSRPDVFAFLDRARAETDGLKGSIQALGPAPEPMEKRGGKYYGQLLLRAATRKPLHSTLSALDRSLRDWPQTRRVKWSIDVDPNEL